MPELAKQNQNALSDLVRDAATKDSAEVLRLLGTSPAGLTEDEAAARLEQYGPNEVGREKHEGWLQRLYIAARNPLVILLLVLATISFVAPEGDARAGVVMLLMVVLGLALRFIQETKANTAAAKLKAMISVTATVVRDGQAKEIPLQHLVPGDVVKLSAGDMVPGDVRLLSAKDLFVIQATLTGESMPVEKTDAADVRGNVSSIERTNTCFLGTSVESGSATAVIVATGAQTYFGKVAKSLSGRQVETAFDKGVNRFTWLMIRFMLVMVPLVFIIYGSTKHDWHMAFFFSLVRGGGADAGDAADDRLGLPLQGRAGDVEEEGHRQTPQLDPELRRHERAVHRQDRHAHHGPRHPRNLLRRLQERERGRAPARPTSSATSKPASRTSSTAPCSTTRSCMANSRLISSARWTKSPSTSPAA